MQLRNGLRINLVYLNLLHNHCAYDIEELFDKDFLMMLILSGVLYYDVNSYVHHYGYPF